MAAVLLLNTMAQNNSSNANDDVKPTILHDFLGSGCAPLAKFAAASDAAGCSSPSASVSGCGGRGGGPVSTTSDLGSEKQVGTLYEGVPFFGQKTDILGSKIQYSGGKRSHSDSGFMPPSHLMKMLRNAGQERPRWPHDDEPFMGVHQMRPTSSSHMAQPANASKWERAIPVNVGPVLQSYPPRASQGVPYGYQPVSNRFKDSNTGSPLISQLAADEGSRTGIKGSGILSSVNVGGAVAEPNSSKLKSLVNNNEPNSSTPLFHQGSISVSRQMTIFYGGKAHVFDDVHPNKADVIMALAGSNGGSWSTSFLPNSSPKQSSGGQGKPMQAAAEQKSEEKQ